MLKDSKEVLAKAAQEMAYNFEKCYHGCSQAVIRAVFHAMGVQEKGLFVGAFPLAGGLGLKQGTCGAIVGGIMCLSLLSKKYGRPWDEFNTWTLEQVVNSLNAVGEFYDRVTYEIGGVSKCREVSGIELKTIEDAKKYCESPNFEVCCVNCGKVARMVVETLLEDS